MSIISELRKWYTDLFDNPVWRSIFISGIAGLYYFPIKYIGLSSDYYVVPGTIVSAAVIGFVL